MRRTAVLLAFLLIGGVASSAQIAHASVNIPLHHWVYDAIERLTAMGMIDTAMITTKPYSRKQAAKYVARIIERIRSEDLKEDGREVIAEPLLDRLMRELRPELIDLEVVSPNGDPRDPLIRYGGQARMEVDAFAVDDQPRRFRENRGGEFYADGVQLQTDVRGWVEVTDMLAVSAQPKVISDQDVLGPADDQNIYVRELNAKLTAYNVSLQVGRGTLWWGPGYHGSLLLTNHAFPFDMVQLGSEEPFQLPWKLRWLGDWKMNTFLTRLQENREFPHAKVFGLRITWQPVGWLELGFGRLTQFGGEGFPGPADNFPEAVARSYFGGINPVSLQINEVASFDFRARIPHVDYLVPFPAGMQIYGELGSEDDIVFEGTTLAGLVGVYIPQLFKDGRSDLRIEVARTDLTSSRDGSRNNWYNHSTFVSGLRFKNGFPLGHHMGSDGFDLFIRSSRPLMENLFLAAHFNYQKRGVTQPVTETKKESSVEATWWVTDSTQWSLSYVYQDIDNPGQVTSITPFELTFDDGVTSNNHLLWTTLTYSF